MPQADSRLYRLSSRVQNNSSTFDVIQHAPSPLHVLSYTHATGVASVSFKTKTNNGVSGASLPLWVLFIWTEQDSFIYLFVLEVQLKKQPQQIIIKIINHLPGTSRVAGRQAGRQSGRRAGGQRQPTPQADRHNAQRATLRIRPVGGRLVAARTHDSTSSLSVRCRFVAGIVSEFCLVLLQAPCTLDAYAVNVESGAGWQWQL